MILILKVGETGGFTLDFLGIVSSEIRHGIGVSRMSSGVATYRVGNAVSIVAVQDINLVGDEIMGRHEAKSFTTMADGACGMALASRTARFLVASLLASGDRLDGIEREGGGGGICACGLDSLERDCGGIEGLGPGVLDHGQGSVDDGIIDRICGGVGVLVGCHGR